MIVFTRVGMTIGCGKSLPVLREFVFVLFLLCVKQATLGFHSAAGEAVITKCMERERRALLMFKEALVDEFGVLSSWGSEEAKKDCCKWTGLQCSNLTSHVIILDLHAPLSAKGVYSPYQLLRGTLSPSLLELQHLGYLDLSNIDFGYSPIPKFIGSFPSLQYLVLNSANFGGTIPPQLGNLTNLRFLDISSTKMHMNVANLNWLSNLHSLTYLHMELVNLSTAFDWLDAVTRLPNLSTLSLSFCGLPSVNSPSFSLNFSHLYIASLHLDGNYLTSSMYRWLFNSSSRLYDLNLDHNQLEGPMPDTFGEITSLQHLSLVGNHLQGLIPKTLGNLCSLMELHLDSNNFSGNVVHFLNKLSGCAEASLKALSLSGNQLTGSLPDITRYSSLIRLSISGNHLNGFSQENIGQKSTLEFLDLSQNQIRGSLPDLTGYLSLIDLNLASNQLNGSLTETIGQLPELVYLNISFNSLEGVVSEVHLSNLTKLKYLGLSFNSLALQLSSQWIPPFQLDTIQLASCRLGPHFPKWLQTQREFSRLDISNSGISDAIPTWFWNLSTGLVYLNLSSNQISGTLPDLSSKFFGFPGIDLSYNQFEGPAPAFPHTTASLNLSKNKFSGTLSFICALQFGFLAYLDLSYNLFSGGLPDCRLHSLVLIDLNLAYNKLSGMIPSSFGSLVQLQTLNLHNNSFSGVLPQFLQNCTMLLFLDLGVNKFSGSVPSWIGESLPRLYVLDLSSNKLNGSIPLHVCRLRNLHILDLSQNEISGPIPECLYNLTAMAQRGSSFGYVDHQYFSAITDMLTGGESRYLAHYIDAAMVRWKGRQLEYGSRLGLFKSIDLSSNKLTGLFPEGVTSLFELVALNLSRNQLHGTIPQKIGQLKQLESLDLSRNQFSGGIPATMSELTYLSYLDLSYNQLSGIIPSSTQLQGFDASAYIGNAGLCGPPLTPTCPGDKVSHVPPGFGEVQEDGDEFERWFYIGTGAGFVTGFWGVSGAILLIRSWRHAYFRFLGYLMNLVYVTVAVQVNKLRSN